MGALFLGVAALAFVDALAITRDYVAAGKSAATVYLFAPFLFHGLAVIF